MVAWWWMLACPAPEQNDRPAPHDSGSVDVVATWTPDPTHPTRAMVTWSPAAPAVLRWTDGVESVTLAADAPPLTVTGLPAGADLAWSLEAEGQRTPDRDVLVAAPPADLTPWVVTELVPDASVADDRWFLTVNFTFRDGGASYAVVVDARGRLRWWRGAEPGRRILRARRSRDGSAILWASIDEDPTDRAPGLIIREPLDGTAPIVTVAPFLHHDFVETDDGYAYLAYVDRDVRIGVRNLPMTSDAVRLVALGGQGEVEEIFNFFDDWPAPPSQPCSHSVFGNFVPGRVEWTHSNSLVPMEGGGWWILARYLDQVAAIGPDGSLGAIVGGATPTIPFDGDGLPMAHGHFSQVTPDGHLLIFSNGDHEHQLEGSRVVELAIDEGAGVVREVWSAPEPEGRFAGFLGDAVRVGDHTLIVNPNRGVWEVDADGQPVRFSAHVDPIEIGRVEPIEPFTRGSEASLPQ
jgi:hypothetical protein